MCRTASIVVEIGKAQRGAGGQGHRPSFPGRRPCTPASQRREALAKERIDAEVIDLRSLWPWDKAAVLASVEKTGRLLVVHEAVQVGGFGAEVAATVAERAHSKLKGAVKRLGAPRAPIGYAPNLEDQVRVTPEQIAQRRTGCCG